MTTSPIDEGLLEPVLARGLGASRTLPAAAYLSPAVLDWELERFFEAGWTCLGRSDDVGEPGSQRAYAAGRSGVLIVRDRAGAIHGFYNACRHRGHELLGVGDARRAGGIKCPYHAWVYRLDGDLAGAPRFGDVEGFRTEDYPLIRVRVAEWRGWLFVNLSGDAPELRASVGNLDELVSGWEPERLVVSAVHRYEIDANWKTITENYHECYHCPSIHPALCAVTPPDSGENAPHLGLWIGGSMELRDFAETMSLTGESLGVRIRGLSDRQAREVYYVGLFPNLLISLHPDYVMTHRLEPVAPGRTIVTCEWLFPPEASERPGFTPDYASEFWDITNQEDWRACESVTRGLRSPGYRQGPFAWSEDEVHAFMTMVARGYLAGRAEPTVVAEPSARSR